MPTSDIQTVLRLRAAIESSPSGLFMVDRAGTILLVNREVERLFLYPREELISQPIDMLVPERFREQHQSHRSAFLRDPRIRAMGEGRELFGRRKDGSEVPIEIGLTPVVTDEGILVLGSVVDITARKQAEALFRTAVESSPSGMLMIDVNGKIILVNREVERLFGYQRDELLGCTVERLVPERFRSDHPQHRSRFYAAPTVRSMGAGRELFGLHKDGSEVPVEIGLNPVNTGAGMCVLASVVDIRPRKNAQAERSRLEEQLRQAQKMEAVGRLAGGIAHDFNNQLFVIRGYADSALTQLPEDSPLRAHVDEIRKAADRSAVLTQGLLAFSRKQILQPKVIDINDQAGEIAGMLRRILREDISVHFALDRDVGRVKVDPAQLQQAIMNLAVNARDAMPNGGTLTIQAINTQIDATYASAHTDVAPGRYVMLSVTDTGHGMNAETVAHVFEPFFTTKETGKGTGLGLSMVHGFVKQSGGHLSVYSEIDRGTTFKLYFPRTDEDVPAELLRPVPHRRGSETILLVEDEDPLRALLASTLIANGYHVLSARDGVEGLEVARNSPTKIDLVLTDVVMPRMGGPALMEELRKEMPHLPVIYTSGHAEDAIVHHGVLDTNIAFLQKPCTLADVQRKVREVLEPVRTGRSPT